MPEPVSVIDADARRRVAEDLGSTLFVEAGAGSGKTTALVSRVLALIGSGDVELRHIAAITFTEKAGSELRDRLRHELAARAAPPAGGNGAPTSCDVAVAARYRAALDQLDGAAIGTLHAFAQRLLATYPIEAGLPPRIEVCDEVSSAVAFEERWTAFRDELFDDPSAERALLLLFATGVRPAALRALALAFDQDWDLVAERVPGTAPDPPSVHAVLARAIEPVRAVCQEIAHCRAPDTDLMAVRLCAIAEHLDTLMATADEVDLLETLAGNVEPKPPSFKAGNLGRKDAWHIDLGDLRARVKEAGKTLECVRDTVATACAKVIGSRLRAFTLAAAHERRREGRLEFHDLLVGARALVRDPLVGPRVRADLQARYQRLLLDEFQDTDPIQVELAVRIAAADPSSADAGQPRWDAVEVAPGRLFLVGDPKQSIYRFRRADIATFLAARERFGSSGGLVALTANFRTGRSILGWVNDTFATLMAEPPTGEVAPPRPDYLPLAAVRPDAPAGPAVAVLGRHAHPRVTADELRAVEAGDVVATAQRIVAEGWPVAHSGPGEGWAPARLGDITILVPARTSLPFLEQALDEAGIGYRAESSSLVYATRAVRDLLMVARAADDPTDALRVVAALRTPLLGCGDDELFRFRRHHGGHWNYLADLPATVPGEDRVAAGLDYLRALHEQRTWAAPSELLARIARDRRAFELGASEGRSRDGWRRLRFVIDQARAWSEATGGGLRAYLEWVELQTAEGARVAESVLPETDDDAVRIMTIHAAKGLEFPITILSGMSTAPVGRRAPAEVAFPPDGEPGYRFGSRVVTEEFARWLPIDEQMSLDERVRLLYVAATRARDHLVVSLHRRARAKPGEPGTRTNAELLVDGMGARLDLLPDAIGPEGPSGSAPPGIDAAVDVTARPQPPAAPLAPLERWSEERDRVVAAANRATTVSATALSPEGAPDPGLQKRPRDLDLPPWLRGRYGTAVGRAVHGVLQSVDLSTGDGLVALARAQCEAEAVGDRVDDVVRLARAALASPLVRRAADRPHWRELYVCTPIDGGRLLEGYVDLLYRDDDGLVVVDHKTAATADPAELDRRLAVYRLQGACYARSVAAAAGEPVARVTFVFLTPAGAIERDLADLAAAIEEIDALLRAGREILVEEPLD